MPKSAKSVTIKTPVKDIANSWFTRRPEPPQLLITCEDNVCLKVLTRPPRITKMKALRSNRVGPEQTSTSSETQNEQSETDQHQQQLFVGEGQDQASTSTAVINNPAAIFIDECAVEDPESLRSESIAAYMIEKQERKAFTNAFVTEIGDPKSSISLRELLDVIVCAGKDSTFEELSLIWPFDSEKAEISFDEGFYVFQKVSGPEITQNNFLELLASGVNPPDYDQLIEIVKQSKMSTYEKEDLRFLLRRWKTKKLKLKELVTEMNMVRQELQSVNDEIIKKQKSEDSSFLPLNSSTESLSSVFSNTRNSQIPVGDQQIPSLTSSYRDLRTEKMTVKSLVIQKSSELMTSIGYTFCVPRAVQISIGFRINEQIDSDLARFQNSLIGYITPENSSTTIIAMTKKREGNTIRTDWMNYPAGAYTFCIRFARTLRVAEPQTDALIMDDKNQLTKEFKVMLMNTFDMFDLDNDGLLCKEEIETYRIMSGLGRLSSEDWGKIKVLYRTRNEGLTINGFIKMHQMEASTYNARQKADMWWRLRELGYNRKFFLSTACPVWIDIQIGDGAIQMENFEISYYTPDSDRRLLEYYWANGTALPYMKECQTLRIYKADHFAVIVAANVSERMHYKLDLNGSNNVNIDSEDLIIDSVVPAGQLKQLVVAIAQAENWFICVKKISIGPVQLPAPTKSSPTLKEPKESFDKETTTNVVMEMKRESIKSN